MRNPMQYDSKDDCYWLIVIPSWVLLAIVYELSICGYIELPRWASLAGAIYIYATFIIPIFRK